MSWYRTGTVAVTNGSKTVTGVGTLWTTAVNAGDAFALVDANLNPTGAWYEVESVVSNTEITLKQSYAGTTGSNKQYCVFNLVGNMTTPSFAQRLATFFASFQSLIDKPTATPTALSIPVADENGDIDDGWIPETVARVDDMTEALALKIDTATATATPTASSIPIADANGDIDSGWLKDASETVKGVVKVGSNISVADGIISVPDATEAVKGVVEVGANLSVDSGIISVPEASSTVKGVVELATDAEVIQGTDTERAITPAGLAAWVSSPYSDALNAPYELVQALGSLTTDTTIDCADGNIATCTIGGPLTFTLTPSCASGYCRTLTLIITNGGAYVINWPASVQWAGGTAPTFTAAGVDIVTLITVDAGTTWFGSANGVNYA